MTAFDPSKQPTPAEILEARTYAGMTQSQAAELVHSGNYNTWANWEAEPGAPRSRPIPLATWHLFLLLTNQTALDRRELARIRGKIPELPRPAEIRRVARQLRKLGPAWPARSRKGGLARRDRRRPR